MFLLRVFQFFLPRGYICFLLEVTFVSSWRLHVFPPRGNKCFSLEVAKLSVIQMGKDLNIQVMELGHAYPKLVKNLTIVSLSATCTI